MFKTRSTKNELMDDLTRNTAAPLSVLRAFKKKGLLTLLDVRPSYSIRWVWPFRWEIIIWSFSL